MKKVWWFLHFVTFWMALKNGPFWALSEYLTKKYEEKQPHFDSPYLPCGRFIFYETRQTLSTNIWIIVINWKTCGVTFLCWIMKRYWKRVVTEKICHFSLYSEDIRQFWAILCTLCYRYETWHNFLHCKTIIFGYRATSKYGQIQDGHHFKMAALKSQF